MTHKLWISLVAAGLCIGGLTGSSAMAKPAAAKPAPGPTLLKRDFLLAPNGLRWGISFPLVAKVYDDALDAEYVPIYKKTEPGRQMELLDAELAEKKSLIRRSKVDFGASPTGVDSGPLSGEYGYNNGESMAKITLNGGTVRHFFFFTDRLWKVYDEYKLGKTSKLGASWEDAIKALTDLFGDAPQVVAPDFAAGRNFDEAICDDVDDDDPRRQSQSPERRGRGLGRPKRERQGGEWAQGEQARQSRRNGRQGEGRDSTGSERQAAADWARKARRREKDQEVNAGEQLWLLLR
ncbi:MAG: hypothetical protein QM784_15355 [Polyangiaceae bacterium]